MHIWTVQAHLNCSGTSELFMHIWTVQAHLNCSGTSELFRHIWTVRAHLNCSCTSELFMHVWTVQAHLNCSRTSELFRHIWTLYLQHLFNPLNVQLNPICHLLALLGAHHILHVSRIRVNITYRQKQNCPTAGHEHVEETPHIRHFDSRWWAVSFTPRPPYHRGESLHYPPHGRLRGPNRHFGRFGRHIFFYLPNSNVVKTTTSLSRFLQFSAYFSFPVHLSVSTELSRGGVNLQ
jgi:hypothetical protein